MIGGRLNAKICAPRTAVPLAMVVAIAASTELAALVRSANGFIVTMAKALFDLARPSRKLYPVTVITSATPSMPPSIVSTSRTTASVLL
ncbi:hypothetical protein D3C72_1961880 [compost metagenome]